MIGLLNTVFCSLKDHLDSFMIDNSNEFLRNSIESMKVKFNEYWPLIKDDALICHLLDPRFKHSTFNGTTNKKNVGFKYLSKIDFYRIY